MPLDASIPEKFHRFYKEDGTLISEDLYAILGVDRLADEQTIKKAYHKLALEYHPDKNNHSEISTQVFCFISNAYELLKDPIQRVNYDNSQRHARTASDNVSAARNSAAASRSNPSKMAEKANALELGNRVVRETGLVHPKMLEREEAQQLAQSTGCAIFRESTTFPGKIAVTFVREGKVLNALLEQLIQENPDGYSTKERALASLSASLKVPLPSVESGKQILRSTGLVHPITLSRADAFSLAQRTNCAVLRESGSEVGKIAITLPNRNSYLLDPFIEINPNSFLTKARILEIIENHFQCKVHAPNFAREANPASIYRESVQESKSEPPTSPKSSPGVSST